MSVFVVAQIYQMISSHNFIQFCANLLSFCCTRWINNARIRNLTRKIQQTNQIEVSLPFVLGWSIFLFYWQFSSFFLLFFCFLFPQRWFVSFYFQFKTHGWLFLILLVRTHCDFVLPFSRLLFFLLLLSQFFVFIKQYSAHTGRQTLTYTLFMCPLNTSIAYTHMHVISDCIIVCSLFYLNTLKNSFRFIFLFTVWVSII